MIVIVHHSCMPACDYSPAQGSIFLSSHSWPYRVMGYMLRCFLSVCGLVQELVPQHMVASLTSDGSDSDSRAASKSVMTWIRGIGNKDRPEAAASAPADPASAKVCRAIPAQHLACVGLWQGATLGLPRLQILHDDVTCVFGITKCMYKLVHACGCMASPG